MRRAKTIRCLIPPAVCIALASSPACGGCIHNYVETPADMALMSNAEVIAHGAVVSEVAAPGSRAITDTFRVDGLWKGSHFPATVTYDVSPCDPAGEGVLMLTRAQADMARATGHIDGDVRAYDAWSVLDAEPMPFRLTHDNRVWFGLFVMAVVLINVAVAGVAGVVVVTRRRRSRSAPAA